MSHQPVLPSEDADDDGTNDNDEIKNIDKDIYSVLSPVERAAKSKAQKEMFSKIYEDADQIEEQIESITKTDENRETLSKLSKSLEIFISITSK